MYEENGQSLAAAIATLNGMVSAGSNGVSSPVTATSNGIQKLPSTQQLVNQLINAKDSRWLQLEVCREFQRGHCSRSDQECKFAHPPSHVEIQNGKVTACYDSIKGRCTRENPKCKYLHPPQHLKDQLLVNGKQNLALKNLAISQLTGQTGSSSITTNALPTLAAAQLATQQTGVSMFPGLPFLHPSSTSTMAGFVLNPAAIYNASLLGQPSALSAEQLQQHAVAAQPQANSNGAAFLHPSSNKRVALDPKTGLFGVPTALYATPQLSANPYLQLQQVPVTAILPSLTYPLSVPRY